MNDGKLDLTTAGRELKRPDSGIVVADPDQGIPFVQLLLDQPNLMLNVWEPFGGDEEGGHNLAGFLERWEAWEASAEPFLIFHDPRFGHPHAMPRSVIPHVIDIGIGIHRREDTRAAARLRGLPVVQGVPLIRP